MALREDPKPLLGAEFANHPDFHLHFLCKAAPLRGLVAALHDHKIFDPIMALVPQEVADIATSPPISTAWIQSVIFQYFMRSIDKHAGADVLREVAKASMYRGPVKLMQPVIEGTLRIFGASPASFFSRVPTLMSGQLKGVSFEWQADGDRAGAIEMSYDWLKDVPDPGFVYWEGVFSTTFELCRVPGRVHFERLDRPLDNAARIVFQW